jgi:hypothetical protein
MRLARGRSGMYREKLPQPCIALIKNPGTWLNRLSLLPNLKAPVRDGLLAQNLI